ncbi:MAG: transposase [Deltaproteobacteria bacterium]
MAQDEGRFGRITDIRSCWAPKGIRPIVPRHGARTFVSVYAAVSMAPGKMTSLIMPYASTAMMNPLLDEVPTDFKEYFVIMLVQEAGWHKSRGLKIHKNIRPIPQPSQIPELNPVGHLWEELGKKYLPDKAYTSHRGVEMALGKGLRNLHADPNKISSMTGFGFSFVNLS